MEENGTVKIETGMDLSGFEKAHKELEKGLEKIETEVIKSFAAQTDAVERAAQDQFAIIREAEAKKTNEIKASLQEQIAAIKASPGLDKAAIAEQVRAVAEAENAKIAAVKQSSRLQEASVKGMAAKQTKEIQESAKKQIKAIQEGNKKSLESIKEFAKSAGQELLGIDQLLSAMAGGPAALGQAFVQMGRQAVAALGEMAKMWREQEQQEMSLQNAARNNPYLDDRAVRQLVSFADEMQRLAGIDNVQVLQTETRLASLGRSQEQISKIIKTAADMAAAGVMGYDEAVNELNNSYNGLIRTSAKLYPELKGLSQEAFAAGEAIDIIAGKVSGSAAAAMDTGAGSVIAYQNAIDDLKKIIGQGWESALQPFRSAMTDMANSINDAMASMARIRQARRTLGSNPEDLEARLEVAQHELEALESQAASFGEALSGAALNYAELMALAEPGQTMREALDATNRQIERQRGVVAELESELGLQEAAARASIAQQQAADAELSDREKIAALVAEYHAKLAAQREWLVKEAELRGEATDSLEIGKQMLDAQIAAYKALIDASGGLIQNELTIEGAIQQAREALEARAEAERVSDEERKRRLEQLADSQRELSSILNEATGDARIMEEERVQREIADLRQRSAREGIEAQAAHEKRLLWELSGEKIRAINEQNRLALEAQQELEDAELESAIGNEEERERIRAEGEARRQEIALSYDNAISQIAANRAERELEIEREKLAAIEQAEKESIQRRMAMAQEFIGASSQIASSISAVWHNAIEYQLDEDLRKNDAIGQSEEERAQKEKELQIKAAHEKYKADMFAWSASLIMAEAQAAMAMLNAFTQGSAISPAVGAAQMAIAGVIGALQIAAVASAMPKPPRFHSGGIAAGKPGQEIPAILKAGEPVLTQQQFSNVMEAFANVAAMKAGGGSELSVTVINNSPARATAEMDGNVLRVLIEEVVDAGMADGRFRRSMAVDEYRSLGGRYEN